LSKSFKTETQPILSVCWNTFPGQVKGLKLSTPTSLHQKLQYVQPFFIKNRNYFQPRSPKIERIFHPQAQHSRLRRRFLGGGDQLRPPQIRRPGAHFTIILRP